MGIRLEFCSLLGLFAVLAMQPAVADPARSDGRSAGHDFAGQGSAPMRPGPAYPQGEQPVRRDEAPMPGRMSPEERRQLRHDIRRANDDIYRRPPRHR